jgi:hypothetical protein
VSPAACGSASYAIAASGSCLLRAPLDIGENRYGHCFAAAAELQLVYLRGVVPGLRAPNLCGHSLERRRRARRYLMVQLVVGQPRVVSFSFGLPEAAGLALLFPLVECGDDLVGASSGLYGRRHRANMHRKVVVAANPGAGDPFLRTKFSDESLAVPGEVPTIKLLNVGKSECRIGFPPPQHLWHRLGLHAEVHLIDKAIKIRPFLSDVDVLISQLDQLLICLAPGIGLGRGQPTDHDAWIPEHDPVQ